MSNTSTAQDDTITVNGITIHDVGVHMIRDSLDDLPTQLLQRQLPTGYRLRGYREGDEQTWTALQKATEPFLSITDTLFQEQFGEHHNALPDRMCFVETDAGVPIGTSTAWWKPKWYHPLSDTTRGEWGQVHWVAVHPDHQGRGLCKPMMGYILQRMAQSHKRSMLGTSTGRVWAIKVYLDCGFRPDPLELAEPRYREAWQELQQVLAHPVLEAAL